MTHLAHENTEKRNQVNVPTVMSQDLIPIQTAQTGEHGGLTLAFLESCYTDILTVETHSRLHVQLRGKLGGFSSFP